MSVKYLGMYKWEKLRDGTEEKFLGKLDCLLWELSMQTKLGCADIIIPVYLPEQMYNSEMERRYYIAKEKYHLRAKKIKELVKLIKNKVRYDQKLENEYLYELWISRIFELDWREQKPMLDPIDDINILYNELLLDNNINPYDIDLDKKRNREINEKKVSKKVLKKIFNMFRK